MSPPPFPYMGPPPVPLSPVTPFWLGPLWSQINSLLLQATIIQAEVSQLRNDVAELKSIVIMLLKGDSSDRSEVFRSEPGAHRSETFVRRPE